MRGTIILALSLIIAAGLTAVASPPATAAYAVVTAPDGVLHNECFDHPVDYVVSPPKNVTSYVTLTVTGPAGQAGHELVMDVATQGRAAIELCGGTPGTFTVEAEFHYRLTNVGPWERETATTTFTMRDPQTVTALTLRPRRLERGDRARFTVRVSGEQATGFLPLSGAPVRVLIRNKGTWRPLRAPLAYTDESGRAKIVLRWKFRRVTHVRAETLTHEQGTGSLSEIQKLKKPRRR